MSRHPGQILREDFLLPLGIHASQLAQGLAVHRSTVSRLLSGEHPLTPEMAARLGAYFQVPPRWWLLMQAEYDAARVAADASLAKGVTPMEPNLDVLLTPKGVISLLPSGEDEVSTPTVGREVRQVEYACGAVALVGEAT